MGMATAAANALLKLWLNATADANMADNAASAPYTNLYIALHTGDPGAGGTQATSEAAYTGYARVAVLRTTGGWTVTNNAAVNAGAVTWPNCTAGSSACTHFSIGIASSGATRILFSAALTTPITVTTTNTPPVAAAGALTVTIA